MEETDSIGGKDVLGIAILFVILAISQFINTTASLFVGVVLLLAVLYILIIRPAVNARRRYRAEKKMQEDLRLAQRAGVLEYNRDKYFQR